MLLIETRLHMISWSTSTGKSEKPPSGRAPLTDSRVLLYPSFTPFVVVFTHAIATTSAADLALLQDIVRSLEGLKHFSKAARRLYDVCQAFFVVAEMLVKNKKVLGGVQCFEDGTLLIPTGTGMSEDEDVKLSSVDAMATFENPDLDISTGLGRNESAGRGYSEYGVSGV
jgi:hypothetical protein